MASIFSDSAELEKLKTILSKYISLPFSSDTIPGAIMEAVLAHVRGGQVLNTYDFVDVIKEEDQMGWQVKSTKATTPVTWKRAKIPDAIGLIKASKESEEGLQALGDAIIGFCNEHALESLKMYNLKQVGYCRLIINTDGSVTYFERLLCTEENPIVFEPSFFSWKWSKPKITKKKEQLSALHGINNETGEKWWAWHGLGENQLHFSGEKNWWPESSDSQTFNFSLPSADEKMSLEEFMGLLE